MSNPNRLAGCGAHPWINRAPRAAYCVARDVVLPSGPVLPRVPLTAPRYSRWQALQDLQRVRAHDPTARLVRLNHEPHGTAWRTPERDRA